MAKQQVPKSSAVDKRGNKPCKIVIMGAANTGKSSLVSRLLTGTFTETYHKTVEDAHSVEFLDTNHNRHVPVTILDTSGEFSFPAMRRLAIESGDVFVLTYSLEDSFEAETYEKVREIRKQIILQKKTKKFSMIVVATKSDMPSSERNLEANAERRAEIEHVWEAPYVESSAKENTSVLDVFRTCIYAAGISDPDSLVLEDHSSVTK